MNENFSWMIQVMAKWLVVWVAKDGIYIYVLN